MSPQKTRLFLALLALAVDTAAPSSAQPSHDPRIAPAQKVDSVLILKKEHTLELLSGGKVIRTYKVALGRGGLAPKEREGDGRTPEGHYIIDSRAARLGVSPGGAIMIHGLPNGKGFIGPAHRLYDWTLGCVAVTDPEIDEIWNLVPVGTPVEIRP